jgi:hypothetical protein
MAGRIYTRMPHHRMHAPIGRGQLNGVHFLHFIRVLRTYLRKPIVEQYEWILEFNVLFSQCRNRV